MHHILRRKTKEKDKRPPRSPPAKPAPTVADGLNAIACELRHVAESLASKSNGITRQDFQELMAKLGENHEAVLAAIANPALSTEGKAALAETVAATKTADAAGERSEAEVARLDTVLPTPSP